MKKKIIISLCLFLCMPLQLLDVSAKKKIDNDIYKELENYTISGSGTENDPYVIDENYPYLYEMNQKISKIFEIQQSVKIIPQTIGRTLSTTADFGGALSQIKGNYSYGGKYSCPGNIPSTISDGNTWIQSISYEPWVQVCIINAGKQNPSLWAVILEIGNTAWG